MATTKIKRGNTLDVYYSHTDAEGNAVSLDGATLLFTLKDVESDDDQSDTSAKVKKTITDYYTGDDSEGNPVALEAHQYYFTLTYEDTYQTPGDYYADFTVINQFGGRGTPVRMNVTIEPVSTNRAA